ANVDHCGACNRPCGDEHVNSRMCENGVCNPSCSDNYAACARPAAPTQDNGCEVSTADDPGEPDNTCGGHVININQGTTSVVNQYRILPAGDTDTFTINFLETSSFCIPFSGQTFAARIDLVPPASGGTPTLSHNLSACDNTWGGTGSTACVQWNGTCAETDNN